MRTLPIHLNPEGMLCLLAGGGAIALGKARVLAAAGMAMRVVAPFILKEIEALPGVEIRRRAFGEEDLDGVHLVIAATDDALLNHRIYDLGRTRGLLVNCVDDPEWCDFIFPSILRRGEMSVSVSTGGTSPAMARIFRQWLEGEIEHCFGDALALVAEFRREARKRIGCPGARRAVNECVAQIGLKAGLAIDGAGMEGLRERMEKVVAIAEGPAPVAVRIEVESPEPSQPSASRTGSRTA